MGFCANPIRLVGRSETFDTATGELVRSYGSADEALGVTFTRCGNRRADKCESCSRLYAADTFQLIRAGIAGGKTVPETVADNPLVFATLTAPSFGPVHGTRPNGGRCRPRHDTGHRCPHGRPTGCMAVHGDDDPTVGQPLCADCYDYASQVVWQWWAPELWRRFTITLRRLLAHHLGTTPARLGEVASLQYAKVAEYQLRGAGAPVSSTPPAPTAGIVGLTPHDLRHTAASLAIAAGANVKAVQRMLGHSSAAMTLDIHAGLFGDDLDTVAAALLDSHVPQMRHSGEIEAPQGGRDDAARPLTCGNVGWGRSGLNRRPTD